MVVPAAALVLMAAGGEQVGGRLVKLLCIIVIVSAFLGILQVIGGPSNGFYLYRITNWESATGLFANRNHNARSEEHTSELQSLMRISYAVFCLKKKK